MVKIAPFRGVMYNAPELQERGGKLVAPPYDILSLKEQKQVLGLSPHNILHLDYAPALAEDEHKYDWHKRSARLLKQWLAEGVLTRLDKPVIFHLETVCNDPYNNKSIIRHGIVCLMKLEEFGPDSGVKPHEKTFSSHKEERLGLMQQTGAHLSQVFGFFPDEEESVLKHMSRVTEAAEPLFDFKDYRGFGHRMWLEEDEASINNLKKLMSDRKVYIADGHHRYETALNYKQWLKEQGQTRASSDYVMMYLCPMSDPGLVILPTHRLLNKIKFSPDEIIKRLSRFFEVQAQAYTVETEKDICASFTSNLKNQNKCIGFSMSGEQSYYILKLLDTVKSQGVLCNMPQELAELETVILSEIIFKEALGMTEADLDKPEVISYVSDMAEALQQTASGRDKSVCILNPTTVEDILKVTEKGLVMPRKSTFFYPKVTTGLVINLVD